MISRSYSAWVACREVEYVEPVYCYAHPVAATYKIALSHSKYILMWLLQDSFLWRCDCCINSDVVIWFCSLLLDLTVCRQLRARKALSLFNGVPLETRRALLLYTVHGDIVPFWFSIEHRLTALMPFWFSADNIDTV